MYASFVAFHPLFIIAFIIVVVLVAIILGLRIGTGRAGLGPMAQAQLALASCSPPCTSPT